MVKTFDTFTAKYLPGSQLSKLPWQASWFLGAREKPPQPRPDWLTHLSVLLSTFAGLVVLSATCKYAPTFIDHDVPEIIPSWGASAILVFNAMNAPLAQPRAVIFGSFISSLIGVCLMKLWMTNPDNEQHLWLAGCLSSAIASVAMTLTDTVHPPAGAAALLPAFDVTVRQIGWYYLPIQLVQGVLIVAVACLMDNIFFRYPLFWWTSVKPTPKEPPSKAEAMV